MSLSKSTFEYLFYSQDEFDQQIPNTATIYIDEEVGREFIQTYPSSYSTFRLRYLRMPALMDDDADRISLYDRWEKPIAEYAAYYLLLDVRTEDAMNHYNIARDLAAKAWQIEAARNQSPVNLHLESAFNKISLLNGGTGSGQNSEGCGYPRETTDGETRITTPL